MKEPTNGSRPTERYNLYLYLQLPRH